MPRTVTVSVAGGTYTDQGNGEFSHTSGSNPFDRITIDYESGQIDLYKTTGSYTSSGSASYRPGAVLTGDMVSAEEEITIQNTLEWLVQREGERLRITNEYRGTSETLDFNFNKSKTASDDGAGNWQGFTGTVDYATGNFSIQVTEDYPFSSYSRVRHHTHYHTQTTTIPKPLPYPNHYHTQTTTIPKPQR